MSCRIGGTGFQSRCSIIKSNQPVCIDQFCFSVSQAVHPDSGILGNFLTMFCHQFPRHCCHILCAGIVSFFIKSGTVDKVGIYQSQLLCLLIHLLHKGFFGHCNRFGKYNCCIICAGYNQGFEQILHRHLFPFLEPDFRSPHCFGVGRTGKFLSWCQHTFIKRFINQNQIHQLGQGSRSKFLCGVLLKQNRSGILFNQVGCLCCIAHRHFPLFSICKSRKVSQKQSCNQQS